MTTRAHRPEKAPAFQFYTKDWLSDARVLAMSLEERGLYIGLMAVCWTERCQLPADEARLARIAGVPVTRFRRLWRAVEGCFERHGDTYRHPRLDREQERQTQHREKQARNGAKGGRPRKASAGDGGDSGPADRKPEETHGLFLANPNESSSSSSSSPISTTTLRTTVVGHDDEEWLRPTRELWIAHGREWQRRVPPELLALRAAGVSAERLERAAGAMLKAPGLDHPGLSYLANHFARWDSAARAEVHRAYAAQRWELYKQEGLTTLVSGPEHWASTVARLVRDGHATSEEALRAELTAVRPWDIARTSQSAAWSVGEVLKRITPFLPASAAA